MADDPRATIQESITILAKAASDEDNTAKVALDLAQAVRELAEAHAWLTSAAQAH